MVGRDRKSAVGLGGGGSGLGLGLAPPPGEGLFLPSGAAASALLPLVFPSVITRKFLLFVG